MDHEPLPKLPSIPMHCAQERFGILFCDTHRGSAAVMFFGLALVLKDLIAGLLVGIQQGSRVDEEMILYVFRGWEGLDVKQYIFYPVTLYT